MSYSQQLASYKTANETVQKTRQLVMLYDAVIKFLRQARQAMEDKRYEDRYHLLTKAGNIIAGLHTSLDFESGGEISKMLDNYYYAIELRMMNLNRTNSVADCEGVIDEVKMMRDAWDKIDQELSLPIGTAEVTEETKVTSEAGADFSA